MPHFVVAVVGTDVAGAERVFSRLECDKYEVSETVAMIGRALDQAVLSVGGSDNLALVNHRVEVSLSLAGEGIRPALHLSAALLARLAEAQAALDFDPYV